MAANNRPSHNIAYRVRQERFSKPDDEKQKNQSMQIPFFHHIVSDFGRNWMINGCKVTEQAGKVYTKKRQTFKLLHT